MTILLIVLLVLVLSGGVYTNRAGWAGFSGPGASNIGFLVLVVILVVLLLRGGF